jgi:predicted enzyme related to lactoylglutathione lyase
MEKRIKLLVYPVTDIKKAKAFYNKFLSVEPYVDSPYYVGYKVGDLEVGLDPNATAGPIGYTDVADIQASLKEMAEAGAEIVQDIKDVGNGLLIAKVKDMDGSVVGLRQHPSAISS